MSAAFDIDSVTDAENVSSATAIILGCSEELNILISNQLSAKFELSTRTYPTPKGAIDYIKTHNLNLIIINLDTIDANSLERYQELFKLKQISTLFISHNPNADEEFDLNKSHYNSFIITTSIEKHLVKTVTGLFKNTNKLIKLRDRIQKVSHTEKPKSFYLLAAALFLEPIFKVLYMKFETGFDFDIIFRTIFSMPSFVSHFEFWGLFPLAGVALITQRSWSFPVFMLIQAYCLFSHFYYVEFTWPYVADSPHLSSTFLLIFNSLIVLYFIVPEHRRPFWNMSQKLWRDTSRFSTKLPTYFTVGDEKLYTSIQNISATAAYFVSEENIPVGEVTSLQFIINGKVHEIEAIVRRTHHTEEKNMYGYGVEFSKLPVETKEVLHQYIDQLETKIQ